MQFFSEDSKNYLPLLFPLIVFLFMKSSVLHIIILSFFVLLISTGKNLIKSGKSYKNYCNMAAALVISPILILQNIEMARQILR
jgi:hypothetical protein